MLTKRNVGLVILLTLLASLAAANDNLPFRVIVHKTNPADAMTASRVSELFLKKVTRWESGRRVLPLDLADGMRVRELFSEEIHGRSVAAIKSYWQQQIFSGRDVPPPQKASDGEVIAYVAANPDAIGYVSANATLGNVKVLQIQ